MKVSPTQPIAATPPTPRPSNGGSSPPDRGSTSSRPSANESGIRPTGARPNNERKPYRAHDHAPTPTADAILASQREQTDRLATLIEKLSRIVRAADGPTVALGSPATPHNQHASSAPDSHPSSPRPSASASGARAEEREIELGKLERTILANGHVTYRLPLNSVRNLGYELVGRRAAFVDQGEHIEVSGSGSAHLRAATLHAARKWGNEPVVIYAEGKHLDAVIEHAVRAGLNITNEHPTIVAKVAAERERQASPLGRERAASSARAIRERDVAPIIARVRSV